MGLVLPETHGNTAVILDDQQAVWGIFSENVVKIIPYFFFVDSHFEKAMQKTSLKKIKSDESSDELKMIQKDECYLLYLSRYLKLVHFCYFKAEMRPLSFVILKDIYMDS